jgi:hypothetical protein
MDLSVITSEVIEIISSFFDSNFFLIVKFFIAIYVAVLFVDIVLLLVIRGLGGDISKTLTGTNMPIASRNKMKKRWMEIEKRLGSDQSSQYKLAILEADAMVNEVLDQIGYEGNNIIKKLESVTEKQISNVESIRSAHRVRNEIINNRNFFIDRKNSLETIKIYKIFLSDFEII